MTEGNKTTYPINPHKSPDLVYRKLGKLFRYARNNSIPIQSYVNSVLMINLENRTFPKKLYNQFKKTSIKNLANQLEKEKPI